MRREPSAHTESVMNERVNECGKKFIERQRVRFRSHHVLHPIYFAAAVDVDVCVHMQREGCSSVYRIYATWSERT
jgi:hypothetical protein